MREILGRRRRLLSQHDDGQPELIGAALTYATQWQWPVLPGAAPDPRSRSRCGCPDPECTVPGAHPFDPGLLAATTDARMVRWWWANRPTAPIVLATGGGAPCAVSLPALPAAHALAALDRAGLRLGPVVASPSRWSLLVRPYSMEQLGELLYARTSSPAPCASTARAATSRCPRPRPAPAPSAGNGRRCPAPPRPGCPTWRPWWTRWSTPSLVRV